MTAAAHPLVRKLERFTTFSTAEIDALHAATSDIHRFAAGEDLVREGEHPKAVNLVLSGFACRYKVLVDGRRGLIAYFVPGDFCDMRNYLLDQMDHSICALSTSEVALIPPEVAARLTTDHTRIADAFWWAQLVDESISREWLMNIGQRTALERTAHILCELYWRLGVVGLSDQGACALPFTQAELGDTLGLSTVHVNRTLQELRGRGLITLRRGELVIQDVERLESLALFDPRYLHLGGNRRGGWDLHGID